MEVVPNPVIHSLQIVDDARDVKRIAVVDARALRLGTRMYFGRATIVGSHGATCQSIAVQKHSVDWGRDGAPVGCEPDRLRSSVRSGCT